MLLLFTHTHMKSFGKAFLNHFFNPCSSASPCTEAASQLAGMKVENGIDVTSGPGSLEWWVHLKHTWPTYTVHIVL